jgi:hypothetical protein
MDCSTRINPQKELIMMIRALCLVPLFVSVAATAQTCSGGADGGMDATGNQCNEPAGYVDMESAAIVKAPNVAATAGKVVLAPMSSKSTLANVQLTPVVALAANGRPAGTLR